jgi:stage V sporulation protein B
MMLPAWIPFGIEYACALIVLGLTLGEILCFFYTYTGYLIMRKRGQPKGKADMSGVVRQLLAIIAPISAAAYVRSALRLAENVITLNALRIFSGAGTAATATYGMLKGMAMPLLLFPLGLLASFVITLTPEISRLHVSGRKKALENIVGRILQYTCYAGVMIVCVFMTFPREIGIAVYNDPAVGEMLFMLSFLSPFMCLELVTVGILQGLGEQVSSTRYNILDCALRIGICWALIPFIGIYGFILMTIASNLFTSILNLRRLIKITSVPFELKKWLWRPAIAAMASGQITLLLYRYELFGSYIPQKISLFAGIGLACAAYTALLFLLECVSPEDFGWMMRRIRGSSKQPKQAVREVYD